MAPLSFGEWTRRPARLNRPGEPFQTDEMGRPDPNPRIQRESVDYCLKYGLPRPNHTIYVEVDQQRAGRIADAYDALPMVDDSPAVAASYTALAKEVVLQWAFAVHHGMVFEPWRGAGEAYGSTENYADVYTPDADIYHRHLYFFTGGEPNVYMARIDPSTGLPINDMFRAIHDYYGHACVGSDFGPRGEENAWVSHMQMFSKAAQAALTTETRGQNNWVNFGRQNYDSFGRYKYIAPKDRPYAVQKTAIFQGDAAWICELPREVRVGPSSSVMETTITQQCMYCDKVYGTKEGHGQSGTSHGICPTCMKKSDAELDAIAHKKAAERKLNIF